MAAPFLPLTRLRPTVPKEIRFLPGADSAHGRAPVSRRWLHQRGFTLIELLAVTAILAVLASLAMPSYWKAISTSQSATCLSNLRQMHHLVSVQVNDNGVYPANLRQATSSDGVVSNLGDDLYSVIGRQECTSCPAALFHGSHPSDGLPISAYGANPMVMGVSQNDNPPLVRPSQITRPSGVILLADGAQFNDLSNPRAIGFCAGWWLSRVGNPANAERSLDTATIPASGFWGNESLLPMRHEGKANVIFCDGHVETISRLGDLKEKNIYWNY